MRAGFLSKARVGGNPRHSSNRLRWLAGLILLLAQPALAGVPVAAAKEIDQLIAALGNSGCQFQRNGRWYPAKRAEEHLRSKYEWLRRRDLVGSAEDFIARAGSESSMTGRDYAVQCPGQAAVSSASWLKARLEELRRGTASAH